MMDTSPADILTYGEALFDKAHLFYQKVSIGDENSLPLSSSSTSSSVSISALATTASDSISFLKSNTNLKPQSHKRLSINNDRTGAVINLVPPVTSTKIQQEIQEKERMLQEVRGKEKSVTKLLQIQKEKIGLKQKLISTTEKQAKLLSNNMYINQVEINKLKKDLVVLKEDYAEMIVKSYKSRSQQSRAMFLLSSENFLQAYKRLQYMKQYSSYRKMQGNEIKDKSVQLADHNAKLSGQKTEKEKL
jgi:peptidoglycan hydrolase CwlO-like protein